MMSDDDIFLRSDSCIVMLEVSGGLADLRPVPASWARLELEDYISSHSSYPAIVQEIKAGWINFYGKLPGEETQGRSRSSIGRDLVETREDEKVGRAGQTDF